MVNKIFIESWGELIECSTFRYLSFIMKKDILVVLDEEFNKYDCAEIIYDQKLDKVVIDLKSIDGEEKIKDTEFKLNDFLTLKAKAEIL